MTAGAGARQALSRFARATLFPLCRDRFADPVHGGFHERLDASLAPLPTGRKRLMVQARQLYLLSHAALLGDASGRPAAERGYDFLLHRYCDRVHGGWYFAATPAGEALDARKDLYGHAFLMFALAWLHRAFAAPDALALAGETMDTLHARAPLPGGGFHDLMAADWTPETGERRQNPHMHLLEAVLALHEASGDARWLGEADALVRLFRERFFHRGSGTLREFFAAGWQPHPERGGQVEPGHHFEWVWLLHEYRRHGGTLEVAAESAALAGFAFAHGLDPEYGGIHDQVGPDGTPLARTRRIWTVAEAIKACAALTAAGQDRRAEAERFARQLLTDFVPPDRPGWYETLTREGAPTMTELPGSTPYHPFLAAAEAERLLG